jgi:hypothetical protein
MCPFLARLVTVATRVIILAALLVLAAGCGSSSNAGSSGSSTTGSTQSGGSLVTKVQHASVTVQGPSVVATVKVTEGGKPGDHLTLRWGLIDAVSGVRASESERLAAKYTTTASVTTHDVTVHFAKPTPTDYLVHFALYGPDGSYLASSDSDVFTVH